MNNVCQCRGLTDRDISPWCNVHATKENLTKAERDKALSVLRKQLEKTQSRIDSLSD